MTPQTAHFIWYELMTPDPDAVAPFYAAVVGWTIPAADPKQPAGMDYRSIGRADGRSAGGVLRLSADMVAHGAHPVWVGYLYTPDVDQRLAAIVADGGKVLMPPTDLPVGRIAMVSDPQGVPFYVMTPIPPPGQPDARSDVFDRHATQRVNWNELTTTETARARAFYARHFQFEFNESMDMGPMGQYGFIDQAGERLGGIVQRMDERQPIGWLFYVGVPSIAAATRAVEGHGGRVVMGPHQVPTGEWILVITDPSGASLGLTGPKGD